MRLTDAVEQLRLRAALDVKAGNEDSARRLLQEKRNVMKALELSKKRAEVLEELCSKLHEAISRKESELIAALSCASLDLNAETSDIVGDVRVVSPKCSPLSLDEFSNQKCADSREPSLVGATTQDKDGIEADKESCEHIEDHVCNYIQELNELDFQESMDNENRGHVDRGASYKSFMLDIDHKVAAIQEKLEQFMDVAEILLENGGTTTTTNERVETVQFLLQHVQDIRTKIRMAIDSNPLSD